MLLLFLFLLSFNWGGALLVSCLEQTSTSTISESSTVNNPTSFLGSFCNPSEDRLCHPQNVYTCSRRGRCICMEDYVPHEENKTCLLKATRIGDPCKIKAQCSHHLGFWSGCSTQSVCICSNDRVSNGNGSRCVSPVGGGCDRDTDCLGGPNVTACKYDSATRRLHCRCSHKFILNPRQEGECLPIRNQTGEPCSIQEQCPQSGSRYECVNSTCQCDSLALYDPIRKLCFPKVTRVGEQCEVDFQCVASLGSSSTCQFNSSRGGSPGYCTCIPGSVPINNFTRCGSGPTPVGWPCENKNNANATTTTSTCAGSSFCSPSGHCSCAEGQVSSRDKDDCLPILNRSGEECLESEQCKQGEFGRYSECKEEEEGSPPGGKKSCKCTHGSVALPESPKCYRIDVERCQVDIQCYVGGSSLCLGETCKPNPDGDRASMQKYSREWCGGTGTCDEEMRQRGRNNTFGAKSVCLSLYPGFSACGCPSGSTPINDFSDCGLGPVPIGWPCSEEGGNLTCSGSAVCTSSGVCACPAGTTPSVRLDQCLPIRSQLGESCQESEQCQRGLSAIKGICLNQSWKKTNCSGKRTAYCAVEAGTERGICTCLPDFIPDENNGNKTCISKSNHFFRSACSAEGKIPVEIEGEEGLRCVGRLGDGCYFSEFCVGFGEFSDCAGVDLSGGYGRTKEGECKCRESLGHVMMASKGRDECLPAYQKLGESCQQREQCFLNPTLYSSEDIDDTLYDCIHSSCGCTSNATHSPGNNVCKLKAVVVGEDCDFDAVCEANLGPNSTCSKSGSQETSICTCGAGSVPIHNFTSCGFGPTPLGWPCTSQTCSGKEGTSTCTSVGICECEPGYVASKLMDECLPVRNRLGDECTQSQQCQIGAPGEASECVEADSSGVNFCSCVRGSVHYAGEHVCYRIATRVGDPCDVHMQCMASIGSSLCVNRACKCIPGAEAPGASLQRCLPIFLFNTAALKQ